MTKTTRLIFALGALTSLATLGCAQSDSGGPGPAVETGSGGSARGGSSGKGGSAGSPASSGGATGGSAPAPASGGAGPAPAGSGGSAGDPGSGGSSGGDAAAEAGPNPDPGPAPGPAGAGAGEVPPTAGPLGKGNPMSTGLDRHDALYCGEWQKTTKPGDTIYLVRGGKVTWSYSLNSSGGDEFGDCTMTTYGTVFYPLKGNGAFEIKVDETKGKATAADIVWQYKQDGGSEVHSVQPIGKDKVMVMQNGTPAKLLIIDKTKAKICTSASPGGCVIQEFHPISAGKTHGMFRHVRPLANGNFLVPYTGGGTGKVVEYKPMPAPSSEWTEVWSYDSGGSPWAAVRLGNGNTLISGNGGGWVREVSHDMPAKVVWEIKKEEFPSTMYLSQGAVRLANGNTIIANWCGPAAVGQWANTVQYFEVTPDKKFVWQLKNWTNPNLGPGSSMQPLDEPGVPENPGELAR